jgi:2-polyprenyl-3-methyl-5-hydroxy-6-metoxy-1,4-benzoquinol methylase
MPGERYTGTDNLEMMKEAVNYNRFLTALVTREARSGERLLDFGAGVGTFAQALAAHGHWVECVEPDSAQRSLIESHGLRAHPSLDAVDDASIDVAYSLNVLEHIDDDRAAIHALADKLRIGGRLIVYVPAFQALYTSMDRKVGHVRRYRKSDLRAKVAAAGLNVLRAEYVDSLGFLATLAYRMLGSDTGDIDRNALRTYDRYVFPVSRAADGVLRYVLGKNALVIARRDA